MCMYKRVDLESKLQHTGTWLAAASLPCRLCYLPAVFFCHLIFISRYPQEKIRRTFKKWWSLNCSTLKARLENCETRLLASSCLSVWDNSTPTGRIFMKCDIWKFFENLSKNKISLKSDENSGTLREGIHGFMTTSRWILLRKRNASDKSFKENPNTYFV
jgi:hypothetical protein